MTVRAAVTGLVIFLLSVPVVQSQNGWGVTYSQTEVCALEGSTVELSCTYTYPRSGNYRVTKSFWFTKTQNNEPVDVRTDSQYTGHVTYSCGGKRCTLRITNVEKRDSATYKFSFITNQAGGRFTGNPGVILSVKDPDLQVQGTSSWSKLELKCLSSCLSPHHVSYVWYKNGHKISAVESSYSAEYVYEDSYSCALKGYEDFPSPLYCYYDSSCNKVKYTHRTICASRGSSVDISCSYRSYESIRSKFWFRSDQSQQGQHDLRPKDLREDSQYVNRVQVTESWRDTTLRISELRESDSAVYRFTFTAGSSGWGTSLPGTTLTVTALQVQVMKITTHQSHTEAELRCYSSCSEADRLSYVWFRNGQKVAQESKSTTKIRYDPEDEIYCALKGHERFPSPSVYAPKVSSVVLNSTGEIVESSSVTLTCSTDANPAANITWLKKNGRQDFEPFSSEQQLIFSSIQSSDAGEYRCRAENSLGRRTSAHIIIDVKWSMKSVTAGLVTVIFLVIILLSIFLLIRKKRSSGETNKPGGRLGNNRELNMASANDDPPASARRQPAEEQGELCYATISFSRNSEDPLYSNALQTKLDRLRTKNDEEEDEVEYSVVKITSARSLPESRCQEVVEDPSELYSTVNKKPRA
ncbi:sialic acid-binding Ig-like lectin 12 [Cheilinus undulatus]|uniref:sialic acid-binding Ig-like lectin 12 n=1 Tax=Cheilinus undulatus TaxID=241271 RepID=UPI001BD30A5E|nr:sialic acid-binding Ig-like lectin 12 [Cheilinus undulatus]